MDEVQYRGARPEDFERIVDIALLAFAGEGTEREVVAARRRVQPLEWIHVAEINSQVQASVVTLPLAMYIEGSELELGGVAGVACAPLYRRKGHVGKLLELAVAQMKERGQVLSGLFTPHPALYRRYGWEICSEHTTYALHPKQTKLRAGPPPAGRLVGAEARRWPELLVLYETYARGRNGELRRDEIRRHRLFEEWSKVPKQHFAWESPTGKLEGHMVVEEESAADGATTVRIWPLVWISPDALRGLLALALSFDRAGRIEWFAAPDTPVYDVLDDPLPTERQVGWNHFIRLVDLQQAFSQRPCYASGRAVIEVEDPQCPWNSGRWELTAKGGNLTVRKTDAEPALRLDTTALAQVFTAYRRPSELARIGRAQLRGDAYELDDLFRLKYRPYTSDWY
jgi:predicted acetyltransferase